MGASVNDLPGRLLLCLLFLAATLLPGRVAAQEIAIPAELVAEGPVQPGKTITLALAFEPEEGWHGYWSNPGDAGLGMALDWKLPEGWEASKPQYPVPRRLVIADLMNHVFEGPYAALFDVAVPKNAAPGVRTIALTANYLACTDKICVPQTAQLQTQIRVGGAAASDPRFAAWRASIPPLLDRKATYEIGGTALRLSIPLPRTLDVEARHVFLETSNLVNYNGEQIVIREGDRLLIQIPLGNFVEPPDGVSGILALKGNRGLRFEAAAGTVPEAAFAGAGVPPLWSLLLGALAGGLLLNIMPCVFPILSLKALSLARAGESPSRARADGLAYTAGTVLACTALGAVLLILRATGEQVGWAFQLQQPAVIAALLALTTAVTANLAGLFEIPGISIERAGGKPAGSFATGLLAAFVATPCTGPFMAAALGAALLLPPHYALMLFATLGLGLALPFLALGFVPILRSRLPKPGPWMETFRRAMAIPMGLTALALVWLSWRIGGTAFAVLATGLAVMASALLIVTLRKRWPATAGAGLLVAIALAGWLATPPIIAQREAGSAQSVLDPKAFSPRTLAEARSSGRPVFLWFTADWCVSCKVNESIAIEREATREAFRRAGVVAIRGDWTTPDADISDFLAEQGAAGVPLYLWYDAQGNVRTLPQVLSTDSLITLAQASGS